MQPIKKTHNGALPKSFPNWHSLWVSFHESGEVVPDEMIDKYDENYIHAYYIHSYDAWYLKARCFDEIKAYPFTADDLREIQIALASSISGYNREIINRIDELVRLYHESKRYH